MKQRFLNLMMAICSTSLAIATLAVTPHSLAARELSKIESKGKLKVAVKDNLPPLGFINPEGNLVGLEIDIAQKLAEELLGDTDAIEFLSVNNQERLQVLLDDEVDIAIARVAVTTPRARMVDFSPHYYLDGTSIVTNNPNIEKINDLNRSRIAVLKNSVTIAVIRNRLPNAILVGVDSYQEALEKIEANQAEAFAGDRSILTGWIQEYPNFKILPARLSGAALAVVMPKGLQYKELRAKVNQAISQWKQSGWLKERIEHWGL